MNSQSPNPLFDDLDLQIRKALNASAVPQDAKNRARQRLELLSLAGDEVEEIESSVTTIACVNQNNDLTATESVATEPAMRTTIAVPASNPTNYPSDIVQPRSTNRLAPSINANNWISKHRRFAIGLFVAASILMATGAYFVTRPLDRQQLVAFSSQYLDQQLNSQPAWNSTELDDPSQWLKDRGLSQMPRSFQQIPLFKSPLGEGGWLWKLSFEGGRDLYILEIPAARSVEGVDKAVQKLASSSNSWAIAASQDDRVLLVFMTKGSLDQYLKLAPLA